MKTKEYVAELKTKSVEELQNELVEAKKELFNLRFQNATNQLSNRTHFKLYDRKEDKILWKEIFVKQE